MGDSYYPAAYGGGRLDFSGIESLGDSIGGVIKDRLDTNAVRSALAGATGPDGAVDYNKAFGNLLAAGRTKEAQVIANYAESQAMGQYRNESLKPDSIREFEYLNGRGGQPPQMAAPVTDSYTPPAPAAPLSYAQFKAERSGGTPAQKAVDQQFGKDYAEWVAGGGSATVDKSLDQLYGSLGDLKKRDDISGPFIGNLPKIGVAGEMAQSYFAPDSIRVQQDIEEPIQTNLRKVLGAQYTQQEGENLLRRTYDPRLSEATNAQRVGRVITQLKTMARAKEAAARYYEANGTLRGFTGKLPSLEDVQALSPGGKTQERIAPEGGVSAGQGAAMMPGGVTALPNGAAPETVSTEGRWPETGPVPPKEDLQLLYNNAADPEFRAVWEQRYGAGSVDRWLGNEGWTGR
jgi:hypothetical protein